MVANSSDRPTPGTLYRYRDLIGENRIRVQTSIERSLLYLASPKHFNDPFDCRIHYNATVSSATLRRNQASLYKKCDPYLNRSQRRARAATDAKRISPTTVIENVTAGLQEAVDRVGVLCLAESRDNVVMWSHYASGHSGICLGFSVHVDAPFFARAQPVDYLDAYPTVDPIRDSPQKQVDAFLLSKAMAWKREEEWRIIDHDLGFGEKAFRPDALAEVVLGAQISENDREFVLKIVRNRGVACKIFQAEVDIGTYRLRFHAVEP